MVTCDAKTENGIPYNSALYLNNFEYEVIVDDLDGLIIARRTIMKGEGSVSSYTIGSRSLSRQTLSASDILKLWDKLWARKEQLEQGRTPRKSVGVVLRDW